ncbi:MAG TPA: CocE/NonD family hydrolase [Streptosporangiaceae bacterium]|nr:CocE/NonD family hydrolase [Streptosporangiaceae bacterium]
MGTEPVEVAVTTSGGVVLRADLYLPEGAGPWPVLVAASPYQKDLRWLPVHPAYPFRETGPIDCYVAHGYAYLWLDVPGSGRSEGVFDPVSRAEGEAIAEVIEWSAAQPWCTGAVGMIGQSYFCWSQWNVARIGPPHLRTIVAFDGSTDMYRDWMYKGGIPDLGFATTWSAALLLQHQATGHPVAGGGRDRFLADMYAHPFDDAWHRTRSPFWELDEVTIPVLSIGNWAKGPLHLRGNVEGYRRVKGPKRLVILKAATPHEVQAQYASAEFHEAEILPWYDSYLKADGPGGAAPRAGAQVRVFVNRQGSYREAPDWPPPGGVPAAFYLSAAHSGAVRSLNDGSLLADEPQPPGAGAGSTSWSYPDPQWRVGTSTFAAPGVPDHVARVLTYTSDPFGDQTEFTGDGALVLWASTDQHDIDIVARLCVQRPDGEAGPAERVTQGWLRASHRAEDPALSTALRPFHSHQAPAPVGPGEVYELRVALLPMSFVVRPGERLRLEISNGDSALTEGRLFQWYGLKAGTDTYHHAPRYPSRLLLPRQPRR